MSRPRWGLNSTGSVVDLNTGTKADARQSRHFLSKLKLDASGHLVTRSGKRVPGTGDHHLEASRIYAKKARWHATKREAVKVPLSKQNKRAAVPKRSRRKQTATDRARIQKAQRTRGKRTSAPSGTYGVEPVSGDAQTVKKELQEAIAESLLRAGATTNGTITLKARATVEYIEGLPSSKGKGSSEPSGKTPNFRSRLVDRTDAFQVLTPSSRSTRLLSHEEAMMLAGQLSVGYCGSVGASGSDAGYVGSVDITECVMEMDADV